MEGKFHRAARKGAQTNELGYMLSNLRDMYHNEIVAFYGAIREVYYKAKDKNNASTLTMYLANVRKAIKSVSVVLAGNKDDKLIEASIQGISVVQANLDSLRAMGDRDPNLKAVLVRLSSSKGWSLDRFLDVHLAMREIISKGDIGHEDLFQKIKEISPEAYGLGGEVLDKAMIGILGPAAIPLKFLGKMAFGAADRSRKASLAKNAKVFDSGIKNTSQDTDNVNALNKQEDKSRYFDSFMSGLIGRKQRPGGRESTGNSTERVGRGASTELGSEREYSNEIPSQRDDTASKILGGKSSSSEIPSQRDDTASKILGGKSSSSFLKDTILFWDKEAHKTKYLKDLMTAVKGGGKGKSDGGILGGLAKMLGLGAVGVGMKALMGGGIMKGIAGAGAGLAGLGAKAGIAGLGTGLAAVGSVFSIGHSIRSLKRTLSGETTKLANEIFGTSHDAIDAMSTSFADIASAMTFGKIKTEDLAKSVSKAGHGLAEWSSKFAKDIGDKINSFTSQFAKKEDKDEKKAIKEAKEYMFKQTKTSYTSHVEMMQKAQTLSVQKEIAMMQATVARQPQTVKAQAESSGTAVNSNANRKTLHREEDPLIDAYNAGRRG